MWVGLLARPEADGDSVNPIKIEESKFVDMNSDLQSSGFQVRIGLSCWSHLGGTIMDAAQRVGVEKTFGGQCIPENSFPIPSFWPRFFPEADRSLVSLSAVL